MIKDRRLNNVWLKAAVLGCLWASSEIIIGSFLHNLKIPFRGNILTGVGIILLISVAHLWRDKGLFWRAGLICALMKSISPSAVIFGPMVAIFSESLLIEFSVRLFRRNVFSYILAGVLAMSWNVFQMLANYIIIYGSNIIELYKNLTRQTKYLLNIQSDNVWVPVLILLALYAFMGLISALFGIYIGRKVLKHPITIKSLSVEQVMEIKSMKNENRFNYSIFYLCLNFFALVAILFLMSYVKWFIWLFAGTLLIFLWGYRYRRSLKPLAKPKFWILFALITILSAYALYSINNVGGGALYGLLIGLEMNFRAALIIIGFSTIGTELRNPYLKRIFSKSRFQQTSLALEVAFDTLPLVIANLPRLQDMFTKPVKVFHELVSQINYWLEKLELKNLNRNNIVFITGHEKTGKSNLLKEIVAHLKQKGLTIGGFVSPAIFENGISVGYNLISLNDNNEYVLSRTKGTENMPIVGNYYFNTATLDIGKKNLDSSSIGSSDMVVIDEVGPWELKNNGWSASINSLLKSYDKPMIWVVRESIVDKAITNWALDNPLIINVKEMDSVLAFELILEFIKRTHNKN